MRTFELALISALNESGGAFVHRLFDGHPELFVSPFELQLGTDGSTDGLSAWLPPKYRWPRLPEELEGVSVEAIRGAFLDQELRSYVRNPAASKFRAVKMDFSSETARLSFARDLARRGRTRRGAVEAYVRSIFAGWTDRRGSGREWMHLGHCPCIVVDMDEMMRDLPDVRVIHVVRSPFTGLADARRRMPEISVAEYCRRWVTVNGIGYYFQAKYPDRCRVVRYEDVLGDLEAVMRSLCQFLGIDYSPTLLQPTWNGAPLAAIPPFGGIPDASEAHEDQCLEELSASARRQVFVGTRPFLGVAGYRRAVSRVGA